MRNLIENNQISSSFLNFQTKRYFDDKTKEYCALTKTKQTGKNTKKKIARVMLKRLTKRTDNDEDVDPHPPCHEE